MAQARGFFKTLKGIYETNYGVTPASSEATMIQLPFNSCELGSEEEMISPQTIRGNRYQAEPAFGNISVQGSVEIPLEARNIGYWLRLLMGDPTTTGSGTYTHTFNPATTLPSMSLEQGFSDINSYHVFSGVKVNSMGISFAKNQELTASVEILGKTETVATTSRDTNPASLVFARFNAKGLSLEEGGASIATVRRVDLTVRNDLATDVYCIDGTGFRNSLPETGFVVEGTIEALFDSQTLYNKAVNGTESSLKITLSDGTNSCVWDIYELKYPRRPVTSAGSEPVYIELPFMAYFQDNAQNVPLRITLINNVANYEMGA